MTINQTPEPEPLLEAPSPQRPQTAKAFATIFGFAVLLLATAVALGLAALFWLPFAVGLAVAMAAVWSARRRRQAVQGRDVDEIKDAPHADRPWPSRGVIDDRLPDV